MRYRRGTVTTWQLQDLCIGGTVVHRCGDDTLLPGSLGLQLIQFLASGHTVFTHCHPVIGGRGNHNPKPAKAAKEKAAQLETRVCHGTKFPSKALDPRSQSVKKSLTGNNKICQSGKKSNLWVIFQ